MATTATPPPATGEDDVMVVVSHIIEQMYDVIETLNADIDRFVAERDRMKAAVLALSSGAPVVAAEPKPPPSVRVLANIEPKINKTAGRPDYVEIARVAIAARESGKPVQTTVATHFGAPVSTVKNWLARCAKDGLLERTRPANPGSGRKPKSDAITPAEIRHEVESVPADRQLHVDENPIEKIGDRAVNHNLGFASRPTHIEHAPAETSRNGWAPGMGAKVLGV